MTRPGTSGPVGAGRADASALHVRTGQGRSGPICVNHLKYNDIDLFRFGPGQGRPQMQGVMWSGPREGEGKPPLGGFPSPSGTRPARDWRAGCQAARESTGFPSMGQGCRDGIRQPAVTVGGAKGAGPSSAASACG